MLEARSLTKYYGARPAVSDLSFAAGAGEAIGFLGANGAGKSTTMRLLTGFLTPTSGTAIVAGHDIVRDSLAARRCLGYLPENTPLYRDMRVSEFLAYRARLKGLSGSVRRLAVSEAVTRCHLKDVVGRLIGQLSKGYRQRVGLADCLLGRPRLLILDEPTVGLDPNQVIETRQLIRELGEEKIDGSGRTVFLSTHILQEVEVMCRRVIVIDRGRIVAEGSTDELCRRYGGPRRVIAQVEAPAECRAALEGLNGVRVLRETPLGDGALEFELESPAGGDPRRELAGLFAARGWPPRELRLEPVKLEDIFARLTAPQEVGS